MGEDSLPRSVAKYLAGLKPELQEALTPLVARMHQGLVQGAGTGQILEMLAASPVPELEAELALVEALAKLAHPLIPEILQAFWGGRPDKTRQKALKKAFHHLKARGVEIPPELVKPEAGAVVRPILSPAPVKGYMSRLEGNGSRMIILHLPRLGQAFNLFLALGNDTEGIKDAYGVLLSNKETKRYLDGIRQEMPGELMEMPPGYIWRRVEEFYEINPDQSAEAVAAYIRVRASLQERLGQEAAPDIGALLPGLENREQYLEESGNLSLEEDFLNWRLSPAELARCLEKIQNIEKSPLVLTPEQQSARMESVVDETIRELFPPEQRRRLSRRLLEMAYYLDQTGRPHLARQAQAAGEDLERERSPLERENSFLLSLVMFPLQAMFEMAKDQEAPQPRQEGRILTDF